MSVPVTCEKAAKYIITAMKADLVTMLSGSPGIGKSDIVKQIADTYSLELIDIRLAGYDPTDLNGFPMLREDKKRGTYVPMDTFPLEDVPIPKGKVGFLLFLDEINAAPLAVQAACYKLILDKRVGQHALHPKTKIIAAGNLLTDKAIVNRQSTAMQSRMVHLELMVNARQWLTWALKTGIDHRILAYIESKPEDLYRFKPDHNDHTFACPRTWQFLSQIINNIETKQLSKYLPLIAGTISEGVARSFVMFTKMYISMPNIKEIIQNPTTARLDEDPAFRFGASHMIAAYADDKNIDPLMQYIERLPVEFQTITLQNLLQRNREMLEHTTIKKWITIKGQELF